jgi:3-oxoacyl-[acyl-carrier protein] reductase
MDNEDGWSAGFGVDVMAAVRSTWKVAPWIAEAGGGAIVHISSISGMGPSTTVPYGAVKAALQSFSASSAKALAKKNIRVNAVAPGSIEFPGGSWEMIGKANPKMYESVRRGIPFGRLGTPEEVADVVVFLASDASRAITGEVIAADGGIRATVNLYPKV